jgi:ATP-dependent DNA helicase RecQ
MPVFGVGKDIPARTWQSVFRQLLAGGFISVDHTAFGALKLEPDAKVVFKRERQVLFRKDRPTAGRKDKNARASASSAKSSLSGGDAVLFEALRMERTKIAKALEVPPYVVFPDTTLIALATGRPKNRDQLLGVQGIGQAKLERYGDAFLKVIRAHLDA